MVLYKKSNLKKSLSNFILKFSFCKFTNKFLNKLFKKIFLINYYMEISRKYTPNEIFNLKKNDFILPEIVSTSGLGGLGKL